MIPFNIEFIAKGEVTQSWFDLTTPSGPKVVQGTPKGIAVIDGGTMSGHPSVAIRIDTPDGSVILGETTARLFCLAAKAIIAKYPDLFEDK